ncbi:cytochrome P450 [Podospora conica]|nr:cytochrome P450 [Schizothecium conicum]
MDLNGANMNHSSPSVPGSSWRGALQDLPAILSDVSIWQYVVTVMIGFVVYDQVMYLKRKGSIAGPRFKIPLTGPFLQALNPKFEAYLAQWASGPLSCVSVFHKFVVLVSDRDIAHKVFKSPSHASPCIVPLARTLLGPSSFVFLQGAAHHAYRRGLAPLFSARAMAGYLPAVDAVLDVYFSRFIAATAAAAGQPTPFLRPFREINCALSCRTFFGSYISDAAVERIADDFYAVTAAMELVNVPGAEYIPFTRPWRGRRVAAAVRAEFAACAERCKAEMRRGAEPGCLVDYWVREMMESERYAREGGEKPGVVVREFTAGEMGDTVFAFLFASQDASSSATCWAFQLLAQHPGVLERVRAENVAAREAGRGGVEMLEGLEYTNAVVREVLRLRPPVIFVPYEATRDFRVTEGYTVPKGAMVVPSCWPALHDAAVYPEPDRFVPERWLGDGGGAEAKGRNWLVFGAGPHECLAKRWVPLYLTAMIGKAAMELEWTHGATETSEEIKVFATLFPMDGCRLAFRKRAEGL